MPNPHPIKLLPSVEYLRTCFYYDPTTGVLRWRQRPREHFKSTHDWMAWNTKNSGNTAGSITKGYLNVGIMGQLFRIHRVIWKLMTGKDPTMTIDHKDRNGNNNKWSNIREATQLQQVLNRGMMRNNTSGFAGVSRIEPGSRIWRTVIDGRCIGYFKTPEEASMAYEKARLRRDEYYFYEARPFEW